MKITLAQLPAVAGGIDRNRDALIAQIRAVADSDLFLSSAFAVSGDAQSMAGEGAFAQAHAAAETQVRGAATEAGIAHVCIGGAAGGASPATFRVGDTNVLFASATTLADVERAVLDASRTMDVLVISGAIAYQVGGPQARKELLISAAREHNMAVVFTNRVGGSDRAVYDGGSMVIDQSGEVVYQAPLFEAVTATIEVNYDGDACEVSVTPWADEMGQTYQALVVGTRDYVRDNGFTSVTLGLSGGIDSALVAVISVDALGAENVHGIGMPGPYSSTGSVDDAAKLATNLGIRFDVVPITDAFTAEAAALEGMLDGPGSAIAHENMQARLRALHLFSIANAHNTLVLNTCQKSEDAVGYASYGGDALGAYAPLVDVFKTDAYRLAAWRNENGGDVIPSDTITKPPSAELAPGQRDDDTLPPYDVLDTIVDLYLTEQASPADIAKVIATRFNLTDEKAGSQTLWVLMMIDRSAWKRAQGPLGPSISPMPFADRELPVTNARRHTLTL